MKVTGSLKPGDVLELPWSTPLEDWPADVVVALPRGISRHVVRFVRLDDTLYAVKEIADRLARHEYAMLKDLRKLGVPCVKPVGVVTERSSTGDQPLEAVLITKHLPFSLPYRTVFASHPSPETVTRLIDALAVLLVRLHLVKFAWGDCSLSNVLFRRDAGDFTAYLVDAETGELRETLSDGMRWYDVETAVTNMAGELMDLQAAGRIPPEIDPVDLALRLRPSYEHLWALLTEPVTFSATDRRELDGYLRRLNDRGFDVAELQIRDSGGGSLVTIQPKVVEAGHHSRQLMRLTGLDVQENQARRLLNDIDGYRAAHWEEMAGRGKDGTQIAAARWLADVFEPTVASVPVELTGKLEPAELFHEILEHRWFLSERTGYDVGIPAAADDYVEEVLRGRPDEVTVLPAKTVEEALADEEDLDTDTDADTDAAVNADVKPVDEYFVDST